MHRASRPPRRRVALVALVLLLALATAPRLAASSAARLGADFAYRYLGSAIVTLPTGYCRSSAEYIDDSKHNAMFFSYGVMGGLFEMSWLRHTNGTQKDRSAMNFKLNVLTEDKIIPNVVFGVTDWNRQFGPRATFFAASKTLEAFAATLHIGRIKDPVTTEHHLYYGFEKTILPLLVVTGEHIMDTNTLGLRLLPYPNVILHYARRGVGGRDQEGIYKLGYQVQF